MIKPKKRMMSMERVEGKLIVKINASSLDIIQACPRKAQYQLLMGLEKPDYEESKALSFGSAIHKLLESWYNYTPIQRQTKSVQDLWVASAEQHMEAYEEEGPGVKRTLLTAKSILANYAATYSSDPYVPVAVNQEGLGAKSCEIELESLLYSSPLIDIYVFGTIDAIWQDGLGEIYPVDHKTTSVLGQEFLDGHKPKHQFSGYLWLVKQLGLNPKGLIVNGIQVAKTKQQLSRVVTTRSDQELEEWRMNVIACVQYLLMMNEQDFFPQNTGSCYQFHSPCKYRLICESDPKDRALIVKAYLPQKEAAHELV